MQKNITYKISYLTDVILLSLSGGVNFRILSDINALLVIRSSIKLPLIRTKNAAYLYLTLFFLNISYNSNTWRVYISFFFSFWLVIVLRTFSKHSKLRLFRINHRCVKMIQTIRPNYKRSFLLILRGS